MAAFSYAFWLLAILAVTRCTDARSPRYRRDASDYSSYDTLTTVGEEEGLQGDAGDDGVQGDDGDDEDDDRPIAAAVLRSTPEHVTAEKGHTVLFPCDVENSLSAVAMWEHGDKKLYQLTNSYRGKLEKDSKTVAHANWSLEIPSVSADDVGEYRCKLLAAPGQEQQEVTHTLRLLSGPEPPRIIGMWPLKEERRVVEGRDLRIRCHAEGYPKPTLSWSWSRTSGETNQRVTREGAEFERDAILIRNVQRVHAGKYICLAENGVGNPATDYVDIQVVGKPRVHVHKALVNGAVGVAAVINCTVHDEPASVLSWAKDGVELIDSADVNIVLDYPNTSVRIPVVKEKDFGTYTCIARNMYGEHNKSAELVEEPVLEDLSVEGDVLMWRVHSHMPLRDVQLQYRRTDQEGADWHTVDLKPRSEAEHHVYSVRYSLGELPDGKYEGISRARNDHGWSTRTRPVFFESAVEEPNPESIQAAGVGGSGADAAGSKSSVILLSTIATCLLIRLI